MSVLGDGFFPLTLKQLARVCKGSSSETIKIIGQGELAFESDAKKTKKFIVVKVWREGKAYDRYPVLIEDDMQFGESISFIRNTRRIIEFVTMAEVSQRKSIRSFECSHPRKSIIWRRSLTYRKIADDWSVVGVDGKYLQE